MSLYSVPLLGPVGPSHSVGPDVYVAECRHVFQDEPQCSMHVLVSLSNDPVDRAALWPLRDALAFAQTVEIGGIEWPERLSKRLSAHKPAFVTAVVFAGNGDLTIVETVQSAVDALHELIGSALSLLVAVSETSQSLMAVGGISGFVRGIRSTNGETARQVFLALSSIHANEFASAIDVWDLLPVFGTANAPAVLAEALWFREGEGHLMYLSNLDRSTAQSSKHTVFVPLFCDDNWSDMRHLLRTIRGGISESVSVNLFITNIGLMPGLHPSGVGLVPILCAASVGDS